MRFQFNAKDRWISVALYLLPLMIFCAVAVPLGLRQKELMNADSVNYIRRAQYLLHGQFYWFVSGHWSVMISFLIAPLMAARVDGLYAARIVTGLIAAVQLALFVALSG